MVGEAKRQDAEQEMHDAGHGERARPTASSAKEPFRTGDSRLGVVAQIERKTPDECHVEVITAESEQSRLASSFAEALLNYVKLTIHRPLCLDMQIELSAGLVSA